MHVFLVVLLHLMLACLCVNVSFIMFVLHWVTSSLSHLAAVVAAIFSVQYCFHIIFTANKI